MFNDNFYIKILIQCNELWNRKWDIVDKESELLSFLIVLHFFLLSFFLKFIKFLGEKKVDVFGLLKSYKIERKNQLV